MKAMLLSEFWIVRKTHSREQHNDNDEFSLFNGDGVKIASDAWRDVLDKVCEAHNRCMIALHATTAPEKGRNE